MATSLGKLDAICARLKSSKQLKGVGLGPDYGRGETEKGSNNENKEPEPWADKLSVQHGQNPEKVCQVFAGNKSGDSVPVHFSDTDLGSKKPCFPGEIIEGVLQKVKDQSGLITSDPEANTDSIIPKNNNNNAEVTDYNELASSAHWATFQSAHSTTTTTTTTTTTAADSTTTDSTATDSLVSSTTADNPICNENIPSSVRLLPGANDATNQGTTTSTIQQPANPSTCRPPAQVLSSVALIAHPSTSEYSTLPCENEPTGDVQSSSTTDQTGIQVGEPCDPNNPSSGSVELVLVTDINSSDERPSSSSLVFSSSTVQVSSSIEIGNDLQNNSEADIKDSAEPNSTPRRRLSHEQEVEHELQGTKHMLDTSEKQTVPTASSCPVGINVDSPARGCEGNNQFINGFVDLNTESSPQLSVQSNMPVSAVLSTGRRKSRKAAKPQRQMKDRFDLTGSDHDCSLKITKNKKQGSCMDQNGDVASKDSGFSEMSREELVKSAAAARYKSSDSVEVKDYFLHWSKPSSPLDLSVGNSSNNSMDSFTSELSQSWEMSSEDGTADSNLLKVCSNSDIYNRIYNKMKKKDSLKNIDGLRSEPPDSKGLVDFAHNTMNELLGIYGFEGGSDSKCIPFCDSASFQIVRGALTPNGGDKSWPVANVKEEPDMKPASSSGSEPEITKTGSFHKKVYRSLGHHAVSTTSTNDNRSNEESIQYHGHSHKFSAVVKYAKSKKSYNQKVLNSADFNKYIKRYGTGTECGGKLCQDLGYRDHYHCLDCLHKVFLRKEEMVRHYKWHKKRHDSLQQGFMRYSPMDDCSKKYGNCTHNGRQTHYHCVQRGCDKVYVSTSDVQMHANFHRKDSAIIQEGFQRFRATEDCGTTSCAFYGQRTTHFHCRRPQCNFTFKNKADMEKHKSYHQKDEVLSRDGFKKFMKYEVCQFNGCRYSKTSNHIHCIRPGCQYVLHSTAQLYSHKRKHERREFEQAYRSFRQTQQQTTTSSHIKMENTTRRDVSPLPVSPAPSAVSVLSLPSAAIANGQPKSPLGPVQALQLGAMTPLKLSEGGGISANVSPLNTKLVLPMSAGLTTAPLNITKLADPQNLSKHDFHILASAQALPINLSSQSADFCEVLNLSSGPGRQGHVSVDSRQTMSLPVKAVSNESTVGNMAVQEVEVKLEPEDLSMKSKQQSSENTGMIIKDHAEISTKDHTGITIRDLSGIISKDHADVLIQEPVGGPIRVEEANQQVQELESHNFGDEDDGEDDDLDDDDDDDDKDYGQVEEPTLVNTFTGILEGGHVNESFLNSSQASDRLTLVEQTGAMHHNGTDGATNGRDRLGGILSLSSQSESGWPQLQSQSAMSTSQGGVSEKPQALMSTKGKVMGVHLPLKLMPERRERDESWKKYLIRYTANDACFSRCACLYKDHYHCRMPGCQVIFKSKDGVRGHARFHDLQDSITPLVFCKYKADVPCNSTQCHFNGKEDHYHCNWSNCSHTLAESAPTFARLEHYRIHEYSTAAVSKGRSVFSSGRPELDPLQKRRGRPPKYPKYDLPSVPKVHLTEKEITDSTIAFMHNRCHENSPIINGFKKFVLPEMCPDELCVFKLKDHYHCGRKFCHMSTDRLDVLNVHAKEFHNNITILEGFEFFERMVNCRRQVCHNNGINRHFHCMRSLCDYSFVRHSTMAQHNKKHPTVTSAVLSTPITLATPLTTMAQPKMVPSQYIAIAPVPCTSSMPMPAVTVNSSSSNKNVVKSAGTYYPMSGLSHFKFSPVSTLATVMTSQAPPPVQAVSGSHMTQVSLAKVVPDSQMASMNTVLNSSQIATGTTAHVITGPHMSPVYSGVSNMVSGGQVFQSQAGAPMFTAGGLCLTLPPNIVSSSIPVIAQTPMGQQASVLTGLIPIGQLSQQGLSSPLINIGAGQFLTTAQGHFLQQNKLLGQNVLQFISNPTGSSTNQTLTTISPSESKPAGAQPLTVLLQHHQQLQQQGLGAPLSWAGLKKRMHYSVEHNCGRPFCKLKKKDHYHCLDCNQAFSDPARLRAHIGKHGFKFKKSGHSKNSKRNNDSETSFISKPIDLTLSRKTKQSENDNESSDFDDSADDPVNLSLNLQPSVFTNMVTNSVATSDVSVNPSLNGWNTSPMKSNRTTDLNKGYQNESVNDDYDDLEDLNGSNISNDADSQQNSLSDSPPLTLDDSFDELNESPLNISSSSLTLCSSLSRKSGRKRTLTKNEDYVNSDSFALPKPQKQRKMSWGNKVDGDLPEGYKRVRCGDDCGHVRCAYRQTVTHFHCLRTDCGYGFSDKSRIMQHRIRHERLDALMGGEFKQFRASVSCERADCEFDEKASHFHCLKCPYSCADSSKVPAHRKYHSKLDNISSNGFTKYAGTSDCQIAACSYFRKQTHYHCTFAGCNHAVLGPSQMAPHKLKHAQLQSI